MQESEQQNKLIGARILGGILGLTVGFLLWCVFPFISIIPGLGAIIPSISGCIIGVFVLMKITANDNLPEVSLNHLLIASGFLMTVYFYFFFDPSIETPFGRVNNLGLMAERQNGMLFGFGIAILGAFMKNKSKS